MSRTEFTDEERVRGGRAAQRAHDRTPWTRHEITDRERLRGAKRGGKKTAQKGHDHFVELGRRSGEARRAKRQAVAA